ncbi:MAG: hypothetical protein ACI4CS_00490 [Candidatus Weimeria sp.]
MVVTELTHKRKKYLLVFITVGRQDTNEISDWIKKKLKTEVTEGTFKERMDKLFYMCEQKFGERPFLVDGSQIPVIRTR